jgi:hypothetical protein
MPIPLIILFGADTEQSGGTSSPCPQVGGRMGPVPIPMVQVDLPEPCPRPRAAIASRSGAGRCRAVEKGCSLHHPLRECTPGLLDWPGQILGCVKPPCVRPRAVRPAAPP